MPNNWKTYKLSEVIKIIGGGTPKTSESSYWNGNIPWLSVKDFQGERKYVYETEKTITEEGLKKSSTKLLPKDSIIISARGTVGEMSVLGKEMTFNQSCYGILPNEKIINEYLYYLLKQKVTELQGLSYGSVFDTITTKTFDGLDVLIPENLEEQKSIAAILSAIDDKIENNLAINKTLEEMAMALYKHWFVDFGPFQDGEFVESELGRIPKGWEVKRLDEIITVKRGGSPRPIQDFLAPSGLPWVKISDATASNSPYLMETKEFIKEEGLRKTVLLKKGSLILSNSASPGIPKFLELDACIHDGWLHFPEINRFGKYLLFLTFLRIKEELIQKGNGSVFTNLKTDILKSQLVTLPPKEIEEKINSQIKSFFKKIRENSKENQTLTQLRDTLLPKLISGEVRLKEFRESITN